MVALWVDPSGGFLRSISPQEKDQRMRMGIEDLEYGLGELFPTPMSVGVGLARSHRQTGVEQQHTLSRPGDQTAVGRWRNTQIMV